MPYEGFENTTTTTTIKTKKEKESTVPSSKSLLLFSSFKLICWFDLLSQNNKKKVFFFFEAREERKIQREREEIFKLFYNKRIWNLVGALKEKRRKEREREKQLFSNGSFSFQMKLWTLYRRRPTEQIIWGATIILRVFFFLLKNLKYISIHFFFINFFKFSWIFYVLAWNLKTSVSQVLQYTAPPLL